MLRSQIKTDWLTLMIAKKHPGRWSQKAPKRSYEYCQTIDQTKSNNQIDFKLWNEESEVFQFKCVHEKKKQPLLQNGCYV